MLRHLLIPNMGLKLKVPLSITKKIRLYPEPIEVGEIRRKLDEAGLALVKKEKKEQIKVGE